MPPKFFDIFGKFLFVVGEGSYKVKMDDGE